MKKSIYARKLEDDSGFGVFERADKLARWEKCLGVGPTLKEAWADYRKIK
jgi:hypothetical protein